MRGAVWLALVSSLVVKGQYPVTHVHEVRAGARKLHVRCLVQDGQGLLWLGCQEGLFRWDGQRAEILSANPTGGITALAADSSRVYAATDKGSVWSWNGFVTDTVLVDTLLVDHPVRALVVDDAGGLWVGTYGAGLWYRGPTGVVRFGAAQGLPDEHVNALLALPSGGVAVATDQGVAFVRPDQGVWKHVSDRQGAPDNLVLSLAIGPDGSVFAGTDRGGAFRSSPNGEDITPLPATQGLGPVAQLSFTQGQLCMGTPHGVWVWDLASTYAYSPATGTTQGKGLRPLCLANVADGALWWCSGGPSLYRCDPRALEVPAFQGVDLRMATAICSAKDGRLWFATRQGLFVHASAFQDTSMLHRLPLAIDAQAPVVALHADEAGNMWVGTFGNGVYRIAATGATTHYTVDQGLPNDHVLALHSRTTSGGVEVWFATLDGPCRLREGLAPVFERVVLPGTTFLFDVLALPNNGPVYFATDGNGIVRWSPSGATALLPADKRARTFYSLCQAANGTVWALGPGTGVCAVGPNALEALATGEPLMGGDPFGLAPLGNALLVAGSEGVVRFDPVTHQWQDVGAELGLLGIGAEINPFAKDEDGALWLACNKGLVRLKPPTPDALLSAPAVITDVLVMDKRVDLRQPPQLKAHENYITFRFAGLHYAWPERVEFDYRLLGLDSTVKHTGDAQISYSRLPPGSYRFQLRTALGEARMPAPWTSFSFTVKPQWWRTPWAFFGLVATLAAVIYAVLRARIRHVRLTARLQEEKVRAELDLLRNQVNPHFLFNSFNTLIALVEQDRTMAIAHVGQLSDFFRSMLQMRDRELITLREEMTVVSTYFDLEQRRFGDRIALLQQLDLQALDRFVPPLSVQLLVENAIKHNVATGDQPLHISVRAAQGELTVRNLHRPRVDPLPSTGFGLSTTRKRYATLTQRPVRVWQDGEHFCVSIPLLEHCDERVDS
jgi:ligand-binding sensor domain-containing protein